MGEMPENNEDYKFERKKNIPQELVVSSADIDILAKDASKRLIGGIAEGRLAAHRGGTVYGEEGRLSAYINEKINDKNRENVENDNKNRGDDDIEF